MKSRELTFIILRVIAIWVFIELTVPHISSFIFYLSTMQTDAAIEQSQSLLILYWISQPTIYLIVSILLWVGANPLSSLVSSNNQELLIGDNANKYFHSGVILIGVFIIISNIPLLFTNLYSFIIEHNQEYEMTMNSSLRYLLQSLFSVILGFACVIGSSKIIEIINKLRKFKI